MSRETSDQNMNDQLAEWIPAKAGIHQFNLDSVLECITLIQTRKARPIPVIMAGRVFWSGLVGWIEDTLHVNDLISDADL